MEYTVKGQVIRETGCLFRGKVNDIMLAEKVCCEDGENNKYIILKIKDTEIAKEMAEALSECYRKDFIPFSAGNSFCILAPYLKKREIQDYVYEVRDTYVAVADACREMVQKIRMIGLPYSIKYMLIKDHKINVNEEGEVYFTFDLDLNNFDNKIGEKECARECGLLVEELLSDERYKEFIIVKLIKKINANGGYDAMCNLNCDAANMKILGKAPKKSEMVIEFLQKYERVIVRTLIAIGVTALCMVGIKLLSDALSTNTSFNVIGTQNLAEP